MGEKSFRGEGYLNALCGGLFLFLLFVFAAPFIPDISATPRAQAAAPSVAVNAFEEVATATPDVLGEEIVEEALPEKPVSRPQARPVEKPSPQLPVVTPTVPTQVPASAPQASPEPPVVHAEPKPEAPPAVQPAKNKVLVWLDIGDWETAVASVVAHADSISEIGPAWYIVKPDGTVAKRPRASVNDARLLATAREGGMRVVPLVMNIDSTFNPAIVRQIFASSTLRTKHSKALLKMAVDNKYDGLDLDYEALTPDDMGHFAAFVEETAKLFHASNKTLAVSIEAKTDPKLLPSWKKIGAAADNVRFMAYGMKHATPQAVVNQKTLPSHLERALSVIPASKLTHGMPVYCFSWEGGVLRPGTWKAFATGNSGTIDPTSKSLHFVAGKKEVWCENAGSTNNKMAIGRKLGITRFALWRLGGEDPAIWKSL